MNKEKEFGFFQKPEVPITRHRQASLVFEILNLRFICYLQFVIWNFLKIFRRNNLRTGIPDHFNYKLNLIGPEIAGGGEIKSFFTQFFRDREFIAQ